MIKMQLVSVFSAVPAAADTGPSGAIICGKPNRREANKSRGSLSVMALALTNSLFGLKSHGHWAGP